MWTWLHDVQCQTGRKKTTTTITYTAKIRSINMTCVGCKMARAPANTFLHAASFCLLTLAINCVSESENPPTMLQVKQLVRQHYQNQIEIRTEKETYSATNMSIKRNRSLPRLRFDSPALLISLASRILSVAISSFLIYWPQIQTSTSVGMFLTLSHRKYWPQRFILPDN